MACAENRSNVAPRGAFNHRQGVAALFAAPPASPYAVAMLRLTCSAAGLLLGAGACGPRATEGGFDSANPAAKLYAIQHAYEQDDPRAIPRLIEQLDSDDPAVRLLAIASLDEITGRTYGYDHADPPEIRRDAVRRWEQAWETGELTQDPASESARPAAANGSNHE